MAITQSPTSRPIVTVRPAGPDELPPIPDPQIRELWRGKDVPAGPTPPDANAGHYQQLALNTVTGELTFRGSDWRVPHTERPERAGELFALMFWLTVPDVLCWTIKTGWQHPYLTAEEGEAFAAATVPHAQALLDHLLPIFGTEERDWSAEAARDGYAISALCNFEDRPGFPRRLVNMHDAVKVLPSMVRPEWAEYGNARLDDEAECLTRFAGSRGSELWYPQLPGLLGMGDQGEDGYNNRFELVGTRAWLYAYRIDQAANRRPVDAETWLAEYPVNLSADDDDETLTRFAEQAQTRATAAGIKIMDLLSTLARRRADLRSQLADGLTGFGASFKTAEEELTRRRAARNGRMLQIMSWADPQWTDAEIARRAQVTPQAVSKLRLKPTDDEQE